MFKNCCLILLLGHILGDFYFQTPNMAEAKNKDIKALIIHCLIYFLTEAFIIIIPFGKAGTCALMITGLSHFITDGIKFVLVKYFDLYKKADSRAVYIADQALHIIFLGIGAYVLSDKEIWIRDFASVLFRKTDIDILTALKIIVIILIMAKPANVTIKELIKLYKPGDSAEAIVESSKKTGGFIGILERYIIFILLYVNQYSAVGLVLTAKSIARYHELENKAFAEYYLTGTLLSTFIIILTYLIVF